MGTLGNRIKDLRLREGLSQEELALRLGYDRTHIVHIEAGRNHPSDELLAALAEILRADHVELYALRAIDRLPLEVQLYIHRELVRRFQADQRPPGQ